MNNEIENRTNKSRIHFWDRCFFKRDLFLAGEYERPSIHRLSVTIVIAGDKPFSIRDENNQQEYYQGIILGPNVNDRIIHAVDSETTSFDVFITTSVYWHLISTLNGKQARSFTPTELLKTQKLCRENFYKELNQKEVSSFFESVVYALCDRTFTKKIDSRIEEVCELIEEYPADEISINFLAGKINLSESRLRALFKQEMQCALSLYIRNVAVWKTLPMLAQGLNFTQAAHEAGFHDLSHYSRAVAGFTGGSPSDIHSDEFSLTFGFDTK
ncbi:MAG: AraC-like DNA-binding protein [Pseudohongiellaceae bacterium]|jgi:AraC-like DNA-binding protein